MLEAVVEAVTDGLVSVATLDQAIARINNLRTTLRTRWGDNIFTRPPAKLVEKLGSEAQNARLAETIAKAAIKSFGEHHTVSLPKTRLLRNTMALFVTPYQTRLDPLQAPVQTALAKHFPSGSL